MVSVMDDNFIPQEIPQSTTKKDLQIINADEVYNKYLRESSTNKKSHENIFSMKNQQPMLFNLEEFSSSEDTGTKLNESDFPLTQLIKERTLVYKQNKNKKQNEDQILAQKFQEFQDLIEEFNKKNLQFDQLAQKKLALENKNQMYQKLLLSLKLSKQKQEQLQKAKKRANS